MSRRNTYFISRKAIFLAEFLRKIQLFFCDRMERCARDCAYHRKRVAETPFFISRKANFLEKFTRKIGKIIFCDRMESCTGDYAYHRKRVAETPFLFLEQRFFSQEFLRNILIFSATERKVVQEIMLIIENELQKHLFYFTKSEFLGKIHAKN